MSINTHILNIFRAVIANTYWYKAPTPGTGDYVVLDLVSEITAMSKDIAAASTPGSKMRVQARAYSSDTDTCRTIINQCAQIIRTTTNNTASGITWKHAEDTSIQGGYTPRENRFYYVIDFTIYYK